MRTMTASIVFGTLVATSAISQEIRFEVKDVGVLDHNLHGEGVVIVVQPSEMPDAGMRSPEITSAVERLCNVFAVQALLYVEEQVGLSDPDFIGIRIVSGGTFGSYYFQAYSIVESGCGSAL